MNLNSRPIGKGDLGSEAIQVYLSNSRNSSEAASRFTAEVVTPKYRAISAALQSSIFLDTDAGEKVKFPQQCQGKDSFIVSPICTSS